MFTSGQQCVSQTSILYLYKCCIGYEVWYGQDKTIFLKYLSTGLSEKGHLGCMHNCLNLISLCSNTLFSVCGIVIVVLKVPNMDFQCLILCKIGFFGFVSQH